MHWLLFLLPLLALAACATAPQSSRGPSPRQVDSYATLYLGADGSVVSSSTKAARPQSGGWWKGDTISGSPSIVIDLSAQEARFHRGGQLAGVSPVSTGREGYRTPSGSFSVIQKDAEHRSNLYGDYVDSSGSVLVRNIGVVEDPRPPGASFRGAPMPYYMRITGGVGMHAGYLPGVPDSHGCIRLPKDMAAIFYANAPAGTPVTVTR